MSEGYFSVHNHTDYSNAALGFSDCINRVPALIQHAYDIGLAGVCITDHECISSYVQALAYHKKMEKTRPFTLGLGNEIYLLTEQEYLDNKENGGNTPYYHCILLALDTEGYHQICQLSTLAWSRAWKSSIWRKPTLYEDLEQIVAPNPGHLICSTACLGGRMDKLLLDGKWEQAVDEGGELDRLLAIFGAGNVYLEVQPAKEVGNEQSRANRLLWKAHHFRDVPIIVTTDSHYLKAEDALVHKVFLNSQDGEREVEDFYATAYMMDEAELRDKLSVDFTTKQIDEMFLNTQAIQARITDYNILHNPIIPQVPLDKIPNFAIAHCFSQYYDRYPNFAHYAHATDIHEAFFFWQAEQGLQKKIVAKDKDIEKYIARLDIEWNELKKISEALGNSMVSYYSTMAELIDIMWGVGSFVGAGRGSAAGFLTTYILDITQIDPVPLGDLMPYWRHVALERGAELAD